MKHRTIENQIWIILKWGCVAFYKLFDPQRTKLGPRGLKSVFVGYV